MTGARPREAVRVEPLAPAHVPALARLFEACGSSCFCAYWHFEGTKNEWLDRCAHRPEVARLCIGLPVAAEIGMIGRLHAGPEPQHAGHEGQYHQHSSLRPPSLHRIHVAPSA